MSDGAMKNKPFAALGILFVVLAAVALVHPQFLMPGEKHEVEIASQKVIMETRRVIVIPRVMSGCLVLAGGLLIYAGFRRP
jgi:hypothetical protein